MSIVGNVGKYRRKPIMVMAIQWRHNTTQEVEEFLGSDFMGRDLKNTHILINNPKALLVASEGDYVVRDYDGNCYCFTEDEFRKNFDLVEVNY